MKGMIKLSKNYKPFFSKYVDDGPRQREFGATIGKTVGACVKAGVAALPKKIKQKNGKMTVSGAEMRDVVRKCAPPKKV